MKCNKCKSSDLLVKTVMDFTYHKCTTCGNEQKIIDAVDDFSQAHGEGRLKIDNAD